MKKKSRPREESIKKPEVGGDTWKVFTNPKTHIKHTGKKKHGSVEYAFWRIETLQKRVIILTLEHNLVWGNRKLYVNGVVAFDSGWKFKLVGELRFTLDGTVCILNMHVKYTDEAGYARRPYFTYELYVKGKFHERLERMKTLSLWHAGDGENTIEVQFDSESMLVYVSLFNTLYFREE